jgi:isoamylase
MISHGDEYGRTQQGNNNAYCQDSELAWMDWNWDDRQRKLHDFTKEDHFHPQRAPGNP